MNFTTKPINNLSSKLLSFLSSVYVVCVNNCEKHVLNFKLLDTSNNKNTSQM